MSTATAGPTAAEPGGIIAPVMDEGASTGAVKVPTGTTAWAAYAKERYDAAEKRLADFRNWARQLAAATGAVIGVEIAIGTQIFKAADQHNGWTSALAAIVWLAIVLSQVHLLRDAIRAGYIGQGHQGPESASVVAAHVTDEVHTRQLLGAYYAKGGDRLHAVAEGVVRDVSGLAHRFISSLNLLFVSVALAAALALFSSR